MGAKHSGVYGPLLSLLTVSSIRANQRPLDTLPSHGHSSILQSGPFRRHIWTHSNPIDELSPVPLSAARDEPLLSRRGPLSALETDYPRCIPLAASVDIGYRPRMPPRMGVRGHWRHPNSSAREQDLCFTSLAHSSSDVLFARLLKLLYVHATVWIPVTWPGMSVSGQIAHHEPQPRTQHSYCRIRADKHQR